MSDRFWLGSDRFVERWPSERYPELPQICASLGAVPRVRWVGDDEKPYPLGKYVNSFLGEEPLGNMLSDLGVKEEYTMHKSLRNIRKVTVECADGSTFEGGVTNIEGCPYNYSSVELTVRIGQKNGTYGIEKVIFDNPATIVFWTDGTKTVVNCMDNVEVKEKIVDGKKTTVKKPRKCDTFSKEVGLAMAIAKKHFGNNGNYNNVFKQFTNTED